MIPFTLATAGQEPEAFAAEHLADGGRRRRGRGLPLRPPPARRPRRCSRGSVTRCRSVPLLAGVSSSEIRRLVHEGDLAGAAALLGRPFELDGTVVPGDQRGGTLGYPTANLALDPALLVPRYGIYAGAARAARARPAVPSGDLDRHESPLRRQRAPDRAAPARLRGRPLRPAARGRAVGAAARRAGVRERGELVAQIARDVERARAPPFARPEPAPESSAAARRVPTPPRIACRAASGDQADSAEVVVLRRPAPNWPARRFELRERVLVDPGLRVHERADRMEARPRHRLGDARAPRRALTPLRRRAPSGGAYRRPSRSRARGRRRRRRGSAPSCSPSSPRPRAARGGGRPRRACCSGAGRSRGGSRRCRGRGSSSAHTRDRPRPRRSGSSCARQAPCPRARRGA